MGNCASCTLPVHVSKNSIRGTKVIFPSGDVRRFYEPTKAAELMLETPNFFLVNAKSMKTGSRFSALNADEDLEIGCVYVFFPMKRLNTAATAADMGLIFAAASSPAAKRLSRIAPCGGDMTQVVESTTEKCTAAVKMNLDEIVELLSPEIRNKLSVCRSKKPLLETIVEEPIVI